MKRDEGPGRCRGPRSSGLSDYGSATPSVVRVPVTAQAAAAAASVAYEVLCKPPPLLSYSHHLAEVGVFAERQNPVVLYFSTAITEVWRNVPFAATTAAPVP